MSRDIHPSALDLDRMALGVSSPALADHLAACELCRAHVQRVTTRVAMPASLRERAERRDSALTRLLRWFWLPGGAAVLAAAAVLIVIRPTVPAPSGGDDLGVKGMPSVALYFLRGGKTALWDGRAPFAPGDRIELRITAEGFRFVSVGSPEHEGAPPAWLYSGAVDPSRPVTLPTSWKIDDSPGTEHLSIVLSQQQLAGTELDAAEAAQLRNKTVWTTRLALPKHEPQEKP